MKDRILAVSGSDTVKNVLSAVCLVTGFIVSHYFAGEVILYQVLAVLAGMVSAVVIFLTTDKGRELSAFLVGARSELRKMVWPTRKEALQSTLVVLGMVLLVSIMLWLVDLFFAWIMQIIIK